MRRKILCSILVISLLLAISAIPAFAADLNSSFEKAVDLKILGLFKGSDKGYELERIPTRIEGAVMLLRLLGKEQDAMEMNFSHPFSDVPAWADKLVGYMYQKGLTKGISAAAFGSSEQLSARQYVTFVLRALGYNDQGNDFTYENALDKAVQAGLFTSSEASSLKNRSDFYRNDLVGISYSALKTKLKASSKTLLDKLVSDDKAVSKTAASTLGLYTSDLFAQYGNIQGYKPALTTNGYVAKNSTDLFNILKKSLYANETPVKIDISNYGAAALNDFKVALDNARDAVTKVTGVEYFISSWKAVSNYTTLTATINYRYSKAGFQALKQHATDALNKARYAVAGFIRQNMCDYDKELNIHNYIINNTRFDMPNYLAGTLPDESFAAYGCLVSGKAVCEGYSKAFKLMCDLSALDCMVVVGESLSGGSWEGHAWNIVKIDGKYYHIDTTFDDPVNDKGTDVLTYYYFNLADNEISKSHRWDTSGYPVCNSAENNYYYKNGLVVRNPEELKNTIMEALNEKAPRIELKAENYSSEYYKPNEIILKSGAVSGFSTYTNNYLGIFSISDIKYR